MLKKVSIYVASSLLGMCFLSVNAQAQEEGGVEERVVPIVVNNDSSTVESTMEDGKVEMTPTSEEIKAPKNETLSTIPIKINTVPAKPSATPVDSDKTKVKEGKSDISFNIFYLLFYKFKQVDITDSF
ncbi:hypothetical protein [Roseivirga misakiensis]|uniref:Uncharacterized protein n=1 Tax=Roseivirga misakiensis TaxID=1563681 RepID=A0A1E5T801_9BACT|nr:hypothetical protein [Roseivirga misakiensis]OEK07468.1 hypothetical protein BFP71_00230 [Roseivirga misakiensis]